MLSLRPSLASLGVVALFMSACGGNGESRPGPLQHRLDDMYIAQVPMGDKQQVLQTQNDFAAARMARAKAEADYNESATELEVSRNELKQVELDESSAQSRKNAAEESGDMNRINAAGRDLRAAKLSRQAAEKKVAYMEVYREYLRKKMLHTEDDVYAKEARYELAKARLAQANKIRPKGFVLQNFNVQAQDRSRFVQRSAASLQREKSNVDRLRKEWQALLGEARRARGSSNSASSSGSSDAP